MLVKKSLLCKEFALGQIMLTLLVNFWQIFQKIPTEKRTKTTNYAPSN